MIKNIWRKLFVLFIMLPALSSFITIIYFGSYIFILQNPLFEIYLNSIKFKIGMISASIGYLIVQIIIYHKSFKYIFLANKDELQNETEEDKK